MVSPAIIYRSWWSIQVYYGFSDNFVKWGKLNIKRFDAWMEEVLRLLKQDGVVYKGMDERVMHTDSSAAPDGIVASNTNITARETRSTQPNGRSILTRERVGTACPSQTSC